MPADRACEEERCPVSDELLDALYRADKTAFPKLLATLQPHVRAPLALFCYPRSHFHELGIAIAATCEESDLVRLGGRVGAILHAISREAPQAAPSPTYAAERRKITLATGQLRQMLPLDDEPDEPADDEPEEPALHNPALSERRAERRRGIIASLICPLLGR